MSSPAPGYLPLLFLNYSMVKFPLISALRLSAFIFHCVVRHCTLMYYTETRAANKLINIYAIVITFEPISSFRISFI